MTTKLKIENFGAIKKGEIDLSKRFYLFVGYNNSGKSYISQLLWIIFQEKTIREFSESITLTDLGISEGDTEKEITKEWIDTLLGKFSTYLQDKIIPDTLNIESSHFSIKNCKVTFEVNFDSFKKLEKNITPEVNADFEDEARILKEFSISKTQNSTIISFNHSIKNMKGEMPETILADILKDTKLEISTFIVLFIINDLLLNNKASPFFLPASRLLYLSFYQYVFSLEKEKREKMSKIVRDFLESKNNDINSLNSKLSSFKSPYTEPVNFLLNKIYKLNESPPELHSHTDFITKLENMFGGDIIVERSEGIAPIEFFHRIDKNDEKKVPMHIASSNVNQLSTLYLYFKYWVQEENFLMTDEPEENLHPENQIKLLNLLLSFCNHSNNRVLMTTHSPLMAEMVSNYHCMARLLESGVDVAQLLKTHSAMELDISLKEKDMGVYFFSGYEIKQYEMQEYGVFFKDFIDAQRKSTYLNQVLTSALNDLSDEC